LSRRVSVFTHPTQSSSSASRVISPDTLFFGTPSWYTVLASSPCDPNNPIPAHSGISTFFLSSFESFFQPPLFSPSPLLSHRNQFFLILEALFSDILFLFSLMLAPFRSSRRQFRTIEDDVYQSSSIYLSYFSFFSDELRLWLFLLTSHREVSIPYETFSPFPLLSTSLRGLSRSLPKPLVPW